MTFIFDTYAECIRFAKNNNLEVLITDHGDTQYAVTITKG